jgi:hypothetical protein
MVSPLRSRGWTAFLIGVPVSWGILLLFHPTDGDTYYEVIQDHVTAWLTVHIGTLVFIPLMGIALYMLVRPLGGRAAAVSRVAAAFFVVFYGAFEAVVGIGNGLLAHYANGQPAAEQAGIADAMEWVSRDSALFGDFGLIAGIGSLGWIVAVIAAAVAFRRAGAPRPVPWLLGLSAITTVHPPPTGPVGLALFALAVGLLARAERAKVEAPMEPPAPAITATPTPAGS